MISRSLKSVLDQFAKFPVVGVFGPRQSGKTTLVKGHFKNHIYLNFEDPDIREFAARDPWGFLHQHENEHGIILDEFQYVPKILSYIKIESDEKKRPGYFVLVDSQNYLRNPAVTQSLAGRIGILTLLPFSMQELQRDNLLSSNINEALLKGCYPRVYTDRITPEDFYPSYIQSYVEQDVQKLIKIENLKTFRKFMQACAARVGQLLNVSDLAKSCRISQKTAHQWLSVLEASYILYLLGTHYENYALRTIHTPKLFFYDTGLACALLGIKTIDEVASSPLKEQLFKCFIISDFHKQFYNAGDYPSLYFWRDKNGSIEVDCLVARAGTLFPIEIKSTETVRSDLFDSLEKWHELTQTDATNSYLVYGGELTQKRMHGHIVSWQRAGELIGTIEDRTLEKGEDAYEQKK